MGLSSNGVKYLIDGLKILNRRIRLLDLSYNNIDSAGIESLMNYNKESCNITKLIIHGIYFVYLIYIIWFNR